MQRLAPIREHDRSTMPLVWGCIGGASRCSTPKSAQLVELMVMVWMPPPDGIAMCQNGDVEVTAEGGSIHG